MAKRRLGARRRKSKQRLATELLEPRMVLSASGLIPCDSAQVQATNLIQFPARSILDNYIFFARDLGTIEGQRSVHNFVDRFDRQDYFRFEIDRPAQVTITLDQHSQDIDLDLFGQGGHRIRYSSNGGATTEQIRMNLTTGEYYVRVKSVRPFGSRYQLRIETDAQPALPVNPPITTPGGTTPTAPPATPVPRTFPEVPYYGTGREWNLNAIQAPEVWNQGITGHGVTVAVIDTGVDLDHRDLQGNLWQNDDEILGDGIDNDGNGFVDDVFGWDFVSGDARPDDANGHGTHVAGTIAAGMNSFGATGVAPNASIMPIRVLGGNGGGSTLDVAKGIRYAVDNGAEIINLSLGGGYSRAIDSALRYANDHGVFVVAAAGNESASTAAFPAAHSRQLGGVLSVGAHTSNNSHASFSNLAGMAIQVDAPGVGIFSTLAGGGYGILSGTSMAAPHVAGLAALMLSADPTLTNSALRDAIQRGATEAIHNSGSPGIDAAASVSLVTAGLAVAPTSGGSTFSALASTSTAGRLVSITSGPRDVHVFDSVLERSDRIRTPSVAFGNDDANPPRDSTLPTRTTNSGLTSDRTGRRTDDSKTAAHTDVALLDWLELE